MKPKNPKVKEALNNYSKKTATELAKKYRPNLKPFSRLLNLIDAQTKK